MCMGHRGLKVWKGLKRAANWSQVIVGFEKLSNSIENPAIRNKEMKFQED